jgi:hypothetical protein
LPDERWCATAVLAGSATANAHARGTEPEEASLLAECRGSSRAGGMSTELHSCVLSRSAALRPSRCKAPNLRLLRLHRLTNCDIMCAEGGRAEGAVAACGLLGAYATGSAVKVQAQDVKRAAGSGFSAWFDGESVCSKDLTVIYVINNSQVPPKPNVQVDCVLEYGTCWSVVPVCRRPLPLLLCTQLTDVQSDWNRHNKPQCIAGTCSYDRADRKHLQTATDACNILSQHLCQACICRTGMHGLTCH